MLDIIKAIDTEIAEVEKNTNRGIQWVNRLLIDLSKKMGEAKQEYVNSDRHYNVEIKAKKRDKEAILIAEWAKRITDAELVRYAEDALIKEYKDMKEKFGIKEYLEPILESYYQWINGYKFDLRDWIKVEKFVNQNRNA